MYVHKHAPKELWVYSRVTDEQLTIIGFSKAIKAVISFIRVAQATSLIDIIVIYITKLTYSSIISCNISLKWFDIIRFIGLLIRLNDIYYCLTHADIR